MGEKELFELQENLALAYSGLEKLADAPSDSGSKHLLAIQHMTDVGNASVFVADRLNVMLNNSGVNDSPDSESGD